MDIGKFYASAQC